MRSLLFLCTLCVLVGSVGCQDNGPAPGTSTTPMPSEDLKAKMMKDYSGNKAPEKDQSKPTTE